MKERGGNWRVQLVVGGALALVTIATAIGMELAGASIGTAPVAGITAVLAGISAFVLIATGVIGWSLTRNQRG